MATKPPKALERADMSIFKCATRGFQLEKADPIMAYWCEFWVVNQILAIPLHTTDPDILAYTTSLMDRLEQTKSAAANDPRIINEDDGKEYVKKFAQDTLNRAQDAVKATADVKRTQDRFDAAVTFFNLVNMWGPPDPEIQKKIKYAKYFILRLSKAAEEGRSLDDLIPKPAPSPVQSPAAVSDPDIQPIVSLPPTIPRPVSVEDVPDRDAAGVSLPHSPASSVPPSRAHDELSLPDVPAPSLPGPPTFNPAALPHQQQPLGGGSGGGSYHDPSSAAPTMPSPMSPPQLPSSVPDLPQEWAPTPPPPPSSAFSPPPHPSYSPAPEDHYRHAPSAPPPFDSSGSGPTGGGPPPPTFAPSPAVMPAVAPVSPPPTDYMAIAPSPFAPHNPGIAPGGPPPHHPTFHPPVHPPPQPQTQPHHQQQQPYRPAPHPAPQPVPQRVVAAAPVTTAFVADDAAMAQAQKHAKWAISALNFEDVPTAIRELRKALEKLGAT